MIWQRWYAPCSCISIAQFVLTHFVFQGDNLHAIPSGTGIVAVIISVGGSSVCGVMNNDGMKCAGYNAEGQVWDHILTFKMQYHVDVVLFKTSWAWETLYPGAIKLVNLVTRCRTLTWAPISL
jgi:hypothetical protein